MFARTMAAAVVAALAMAADASAQVAWPEIILSVAPTPLAPGATGRLQIQIVARERLSNAVLTASAAAGVTLSPSRLNLGRVDPPSVGSRTPTISPAPPVLGAVPVRNMRIGAAQPGTYEVTVTLSYDGGSISESYAVSVR
ncbi:MAG: hypothetical protein FJX60_18305 [Alphaproteobacteria bacterium]|nr:hypothetical protein [Alphaproteobacteria bacterium]